jgi:hypothetical protein
MSDIEHIHTEEQITDILTKPLAHERFIDLWAKVGIVMTGKERQDYGVKCEHTCNPEFPAHI